MVAGITPISLSGWHCERPLAPRAACSRSGWDATPKMMSRMTAANLIPSPGRKTDVKDALWLCQLLEAGLLKPELRATHADRTRRST